MTRSQLKLLLVDFDGVLSNGRLYSSDNPDGQALGRKAVQAVFSTDNSTLLEDWMRGKLTYHEVHAIVASRLGTNAQQLDILLEESARRMPLNYSLLHHIANLRQNGVVVSLFTNTTDIFDSIIRKHHNLDDMFDFIYSSSAYGKLQWQDETLLQQALKDAHATAKNTVLVDDSARAITEAASHGLHTFHYPNYVQSQPSFKDWLADNFTNS